MTERLAVALSVTVWSIIGVFALYGALMLTAWLW